MTDFEQRPRRFRPAIRPLVIAAAVVLITAAAALLGRLATSDSGHRAASAPSSSSDHRAAMPSAKSAQVPPSYAAARLRTLAKLSASDRAGRIALPWTVLKADSARSDVQIVFASRSCEQVDGVYVIQSQSSVAIDVLASNIPGIPNCDVVPELYRAIIHLATPLSTRSLTHAQIDKTYWPTNPFDRN
jgi:hypothetical protein